MITMKTRFSFPFVELFAIAVLLSSPAHGQDSYSALFIGNSYTASNNLPQLVRDVALSAGDTLVFDSNTPGGFRLIDHTANTTTQNKIMQGNWDFVILQGQSQEPITQSGVFESGAGGLRSLVKEHNPCAMLMPYMTWGRENGDTTDNCFFFPVMCTYEGMDTTLMHRYLDVTDILSGEVAPVSVVWRYLRQNYPSIDLYTADGSHPSLAGSYAAACTFYTSIFKKDPTLITFDSGLDATTANTIRDAARTIVFDQLSMWDFTKPPEARMKVTKGFGETEMEMVCYNPYDQILDYHWDLGDGNTDSLQSLVHSYANNGTYTVELTVSTCNPYGLHTDVRDTTFQLCDHTPTVYNALGWNCMQFDTLRTQSAEAYQWYAGCVPIANATDSILIDAAQYTTASNGWISVVTTVNGCTEMSLNYSTFPLPMGYYYELFGDTCTSEPVALEVHHYSGVFPGSQIISWYFNGTLLPAMTNEDTLWITEPGSYQGSITDPMFGCPFDTTFSEVFHIDCTVGLEENPERINDHLFRLYPNPASDYVSIATHQEDLEVEIFNQLGQNVASYRPLGSRIGIENLPIGFYTVLFKQNGKLLGTAKLMKQGF